MEQRYANKFCFHQGKTASLDVCLIKEAYKEGALSRTIIFRLFSKKSRMSKYKVKTMFIVFFDRRVIVHKYFVPPG